jgi:hypothetical protein
MSYENAPTTKLVATHCAVCAHPLVDAVSVERGIGPDCAAKHGYGHEADAAGRTEANALVHAIAVHQDGVEVEEAVTRLQELGFVVLAARIAKRVADVTILPLNGKLAVHTPYKAEATPAFRAVPGRTWDKDAKVNLVPETAEAKKALHKLLSKHFAGRLAYGPKGLFRIAA